MYGCDHTDTIMVQQTAPESTAYYAAALRYAREIHKTPKDTALLSQAQVGSTGLPLLTHTKYLSTVTLLIYFHRIS